MACGRVSTLSARHRGIFSDDSSEQTVSYKRACALHMLRHVGDSNATYEICLGRSRLETIFKVNRTLDCEVSKISTCTPPYVLAAFSFSALALSSVSIMLNFFIPIMAK